MASQMDLKIIAIRGNLASGGDVLHLQRSRHLEAVRGGSTSLCNSSRYFHRFGRTILRPVATRQFGTRILCTIIAYFNDQSRRPGIGSIYRAMHTTGDFDPDSSLDKSSGKLWHATLSTSSRIEVAAGGARLRLRAVLFPGP